jgi:CreA protein
VPAAAGRLIIADYQPIRVAVFSPAILLILWRSRMKRILIGTLLGGALALTAQAEEIGSVDTVFKWLGPDNKIVIEAFDDPKVAGVTCYVSRSKTGGIKGGLGLAEDTSDASIACRQVGPISVKEKLKDGEEVFTERRSLLFKKMQVVRFLDEARNTLIYLVYSDRVIEGSPKNSVTAVPIMPWGGQPAKITP